MKFEKTKETEAESLNTECCRKFLAGNKTLYTKAFWDNGPRRITSPARADASKPAAAASKFSSN